MAARGSILGCVVACSVWSAPAHAQYFAVAGSFEGVVHATELPLGFEAPHPASYYEGAPITGSFEWGLVDPQPQTSGAGFAYFTDPAGWLRLSYSVRGETFAFQVGLSATPDAPVLLLQAGSFTLLTSFEPKYDGATIGFSGPGLFSGLDPRTLSFASGAPVVETSFASAAAEMAFAVDVGEVTYADPPPTLPVPEPPTLLLLAGGLVALRWAVMRSARSRA